MTDDQPFEWYLENAQEGPKRRAAWAQRYGGNHISDRDKVRVMPHCDALVLHSPLASCEVCNLFPEAQMLRVQWSINFTGEQDPNKTPCPAERNRDLWTIEGWPGNRVHRRGTPLETRMGREPLTREQIAEARASLVEMERELGETE